LAEVHVHLGMRAMGGVKCRARPGTHPPATAVLTQTVLLPEAKTEPEASVGGAKTAATHRSSRSSG
jgi:hypothetical protein